MKWQALIALVGVVLIPLLYGRCFSKEQPMPPQHKAPNDVIVPEKGGFIIEAVDGGWQVLFVDDFVEMQRLVPLRSDNPVSFLPESALYASATPTYYGQIYLLVKIYKQVYKEEKDALAAIKDKKLGDHSPHAYRNLTDFKKTKCKTIPNK